MARLILSLLAVLAVLAGAGSTSSARAETGTPLPPGYTTEVDATPQPVPQPMLQPAPPRVVYPTTDDGAPPSDDAGDPSDEYADTDPAALTDFQQPLAPYGQWVQDPAYGTVWVPDSAQVGADFAPYQTGGQWGTTDSGDWLWQSDYAWGYIPFHYGRWVWAGSYWGWIPGRTYAPAWVTWRVGEGGYLGWAPLPPTWYWAGGRAFGLRTRPFAAYCFVPTDYAFSRHVSSFVVRDHNLVRAAAASTRPYHAATPSVGGHGSIQAHGPASPRFSEAHVPASAVPRVAAAADPRSMAFATRTSLAAARRGYAAPAVREGSSVQRMGGWHTSYARPSREQGAALRTPGVSVPIAPAARAQEYRGASPSYHSVYPSYRSSAPAYSSGQSYGGQGAFHPQMPSTQVHQTAAPPAYHPAHSSGGHVGGGHHR